MLLGSGHGGRGAVLLGSRRSSGGRARRSTRGSGRTAAGSVARHCDDVGWLCCVWLFVEGRLGISDFGSLEKMANLPTNQGWRNWARGADPR